MKVLLFTHKNDIDGMGNAVLANLAFEEVDYVLCGTFDLVKNVSKYYDNGSIYEYDMVFVTDLCLEDPILSKIANDFPIPSAAPVIITVFFIYRNLPNKNYIYMSVLLYHIFLLHSTYSEIAKVIIYQSINKKGLRTSILVIFCKIWYKLG